MSLRIPALAASLLFVVACNNTPAPPASSFTLSLSNASLQVVAGNSASTNLSVVRTNLDGVISLALTGNRPQITETFAPAPIPSSGNASTLTLSTLASTPPGVYNLVVTATAGNVVRTANLTFTVVAPPTANFSLAIAPPSISIPQGQSATLDVSVLRTNFPEVVYLTISQPVGVGTAFVFPETVPVDSNSSKLTIAINIAAPLGTYTLTLTGVGGSLNRQVTLPLTVTPGLN